MASSWFTRSRIRVRIWRLQLLSRFVKTAWFRVAVLHPAVRLRLLWFVWAIFFDRLPETSNPQVATLQGELKARLDAPLAASEATERGRAVNQAMTWGTAGVGVVILIAIITAHALNPALETATAAFAVSVPFLVVLGFLYALQSDPKATPPTVRAALFQVTLLYAAHLLFYFGLAALLWSYDPRIAALFVVACYLALRYFRRVTARSAITP
jgi:hypothetical protein